MPEKNGLSDWFDDTVAAGQALWEGISSNLLSNEPKSHSTKSHKLAMPSMFKDGDQNGDGMMSKNEFAYWRSKTSEGSLEDIEFNSKVGRQFDSLAGGDKLLSLSELKTYERELDKLPEFFVDNDRDGDMRISRLEIDDYGTMNGSSRSSSPRANYFVPMDLGRKDSFEEFVNKRNMRDHFDEIAGDDSEISFPELTAYNKKHPEQLQ